MHGGLTPASARDLFQQDRALFPRHRDASGEGECDAHPGEGDLFTRLPTIFINNSGCARRHSGAQTIEWFVIHFFPTVSLCIAAEVKLRGPAMFLEEALASGGEL